MSIGKIVRKIFGKKFHSVAKIYRSFFVDLGLVAQSLGDIKKNSNVLDLGGGDGELSDLLLTRKRDISITLSDTASQVGGAINKENLDRVELQPKTQLKDIAVGNYDLIILCDVLHHIPVGQRDRFFRDIASLLKRNPSAVLAIKEIEPGFLKSELSVWADRYITGDHHVQLIAKEELVAKMSEYIPDHRPQETKLFEQNKPNYCMLFQ